MRQARDLAGGERVRFLQQQADRNDDGYPYRRDVIAEEVAITRNMAGWRRNHRGRSAAATATTSTPCFVPRQRGTTDTEARGRNRMLAQTARHAECRSPPHFT